MTARPLVPALGVVLLGLVAYLPGLGRQEFVGTEDLRRELALETDASGDHWLVPQLWGRPHLTKPPLHPWVLAGAFHVLDRDDPFAARLPSLFALLAAAGLAAWAAARAAGPRAGWMAGALVLLALGELKNGVQAETDPLFAATVFAALLALAPPGRPRPVLAGLLFGVAAWLKGGALLPWLAGGLLGPRLLGGPAPGRRASLVVLGLAVPMALAWPLFLAVTGAGAGGHADESDLLWGWTAARAVRTLTFPIALLLLTAPGSLALLRRRPATMPLSRWALGVVALAFLLLLLPAVKSSRYLLPAIPLVAVAAAVELETRGGARRFAVSVGLGSAVLAAAALALFLDETPTAGRLVLGAVVVLGASAPLLARRLPALALLALVPAARAVVPFAYVPVWEARGHSVREDAERLAVALAPYERVALLGVQTPRLLWRTEAELRWFPDLERFAAEAPDWRPDAVLLSEPWAEEHGRPEGLRPVTTLTIGGRPLTILVAP